MLVIQSESGIEAAARTHKYLFWGYIVLLIFAAIFTWLVWKSGNNLQDAVRKDADARISEALQKTAELKERADALENQNLTLQTNLTTLQIEQGETHERMQDVRRKLDPRVFSEPATDGFLRKLGETEGAFDILFVGDNVSEASDFANAVAVRSRKAGWTVERPSRISQEELAPLTIDPLIKRAMDGTGLAVIIEPQAPFEIGRSAMFLHEALKFGGFFAPVCRANVRDRKPPLLLVGPKRLKS